MAETIKESDGTDKLCEWLQSKGCPKNVIDIIRNENYRVKGFMTINDSNVAGLFPSLKQGERQDFVGYAKDLREVVTGKTTESIEKEQLSLLHSTINKFSSLVTAFVYAAALRSAPATNEVPAESEPQSQLDKSEVPVESDTQSQLDKNDALQHSESKTNQQ